MIKYYSRLLSPSNESKFSISITVTIFVVAILLPLSVSLTVNTPIIGLIIFGLIAFLICISLFFNVFNFAIFVYPLIFFITNHILILILSILLIVAFIAGRLLAGKINLDFPHPILLAILFLAGINGAYRGVDQFASFYMFGYLLILPIVIFIIYFNIKPSYVQIERNLILISIFAAITGWVSFVNYFIVGGTRDIIGWYSENPAACFFGMIMPFALVSVLQEQQRIKRLLLWIVLIGIWTGIFVTQSRAIYITSIFTLGYIATKDKRALGVILPIFIAAIIILPTLILYRITLMFGAGAHPDWSSVGRVQIWLNSILLIPEFFWFGMGIDSFRSIYTARFPQVFIKAVHPHNVYLRWLFEYGIFGFIAYVALILKPLLISFKRVKKIENKKWGAKERLYVSLNAGMITALVASIFDSPFHQPQVSVLLWMYLAFLLVMNGRSSSSLQTDN